MQRPFGYLILSSAALLLALLAVTGFPTTSSFSPILVEPTPSFAPGHIATPEELAKARAEWASTKHANTFDNGMGANTTCARCKSPVNWDPLNAAQEQALNCSSCKRIPGAPRPDLEGGVPIAQSDWKSVGCAVCHRPVGDSYDTTPVFWNQALQVYEPVKSTTELCAKCHEGTHGFEVIEEQSASEAHKDWDCTKCHNSHGLPSKCTDCHDPTRGAGAADHARHSQVNCTACHDAGGLSLWQDSGNAETGGKDKHAGTIIPVRFAHTLTSWPSHDLKKEVDCRRCHHPQAGNQPAVAVSVGCNNGSCHPGGAVLNWCPAFPRNPEPAK